jgi:antitoxin component of MazEF toxin-antitoxin module
LHLSNFIDALFISFYKRVDMAKIAAWGLSLAVRIPASIVQNLGLQVGDEALLRLLDSNDILIRLVRPRSDVARGPAGTNLPEIPVRKKEEQW